MEIILIILALIAVVITGTLSKVEEAHNKIYAREHLSNQKYAVLGNKAVISIITFLVTGVGFFFVDIADSILALLALSMVRFVPWAWYMYLNGSYANAKHQASSNFTMYNNFAGPIGAMVVIGIADFIAGSSASIHFYFIAPLTVVFLMYGLRDKGVSGISFELKLILVARATLSACEIWILIYCLDYVDIQNPTILPDVLITFFLVICLSSFYSFLYFLKDYLRDYKNGLASRVTLNGIYGGIHDSIFFYGFAIGGPIFMMAEQALIIPTQNMYLLYKEDKLNLEVIKYNLTQPLVDSRGGKDFVISSTDIIVYYLAKTIIALGK
jgi:hypothetical protein